MFQHQTLSVCWTSWLVYLIQLFGIRISTLIDSGIVHPIAVLLADAKEHIIKLVHNGKIGNGAAHAY